MFWFSVDTVYFGYFQNSLSLIHILSERTDYRIHQQYWINYQLDHNACFIEKNKKKYGF